MVIHAGASYIYRLAVRSLWKSLLAKLFVPDTMKTEVARTMLTMGEKKTRNGVLSCN